MAGTTVTSEIAPYWTGALSEVIIVLVSRLVQSLHKILGLSCNFECQWWKHLRELFPRCRIVDLVNFRASVHHTSTRSSEGFNRWASLIAQRVIACIAECFLAFCYHLTKNRAMSLIWSLIVNGLSSARMLLTSAWIDCTSPSVRSSRKAYSCVS